MVWTVDQYFSEFKEKRILVLGIGVSNRPLIRLLLQYGLSVTACDKTPREALDQEVLDLEQAGAILRVGPDYLENLSADVVFRTPGMHPHRPELEKLRAQGAVITSEMETFFRICPCSVFAVTGSDGKTTTTTLIARMLEQAGKKVWIGGNIGQPLLPVVKEMQTTDYAVVELSSFQLMEMECHPKVAVVTNLAPNHLDIHKDMAEYVDAKKQIFLNQTADDKLVLNLDNDITVGFSGMGMGQKRWFSRQKVTEGAWLEGETVYHNGRPVMTTDEIRIPGMHNVENYMAAMLAVEDVVSDEQVREVAVSFPGVEHRIELVRELDGVRYYNDSIASSPSRTIAGFHAFRQKVILIAGGYDKNIPFDTLSEEILDHVKYLVLCGATADLIYAAVRKAADQRGVCPEIAFTSNLDEALQKAKAVAIPGDVVTLSPACAAFDQFKNFSVRGEYFKKIVSEL